MFGGNSFAKKSFEEPLKFDCRIPQHLSLCMFTYYAAIKMLNIFKAEKVNLPHVLNQCNKYLRKASEIYILSLFPAYVPVQFRIYIIFHI